MPSGWSRSFSSSCRNLTMDHHNNYLFFFSAEFYVWYFWPSLATLWGPWQQPKRRLCDRTYRAALGRITRRWGNGLSPHAAALFIDMQRKHPNVRGNYWQGRERKQLKELLKMGFVPRKALEGLWFFHSTTIDMFKWKNFARLVKSLPCSQTSVSIVTALMLLLWRRGLQFCFRASWSLVTSKPSSSSTKSLDDSLNDPWKIAEADINKQQKRLPVEELLFSCVGRGCRANTDNWSHDWSSATASPPGQSHGDRSSWNSKRWRAREAQS